jgi:ABC-2 type transport system permease protein
MKKFVTIIRMAIIESLTYRGDVFLFVASGIVAPLVSLAVWLTISASGGTPPLSQHQIVSYFLLVMLVEIINSPFVSADIRYGKLSKHLLKPFSYITWFIGQNIGEKVLKMVYLVPLVVALFALLSKSPVSISLEIFVPFIIALFFATILTFVFDFLLGIAAFWMQDTKSILDFQDIFYFVLSGKIIPLVVLPTIIRDINNFLPFRYMLSFPVEIALGTLSSFDVFLGFVIQLIWVVIMIAGYIYLWSRGLKRYSAVGA